MYEVGIDISTSQALQGDSSPTKRRGRRAARRGEEFLLGVLSKALPQSPSSPPPDPPLSRKKRQLSVGTFRKKESQREPLSVGRCGAGEGSVLTTPSFPGSPGRPEDEAYDEDGNPQQDFYDSDPPGVGSPASALRDAYALYYPSEKRYHPRGLRAGPGTEVAGGAGWWPTE